MVLGQKANAEPTYPQPLRRQVSEAAVAWLEQCSLGGLPAQPERFLFNPFSLMRVLPTGVHAQHIQAPLRRG